MLRTLLGACLAAGLLAGCSSHPEIPVSDQQALVMESSVLAAGISASEPAVVATEIQATASQRYITSASSRLPCTIVFLV